LIGKPLFPAKRGRALPPSPRVGLGTLKGEQDSLRSQKISAVVTKTSENITFIDRSGSPTAMARSKTGSFWLTETVTIAAAAASGSGDLDLGAYVDVGDQQAIAIEEVDVIWQVRNTTADVYNSDFEACFNADTALDLQLTDLNPANALVRADDNSLIASASMQMAKSENILSIGPDLYPDSFGKLDESRMVVNDTLYVVAKTVENVHTGYELNATVRIKARIVKLGTKDWMAIAIQSTAADN